VVHAFERDCTLQRRHQKIIEIAPAPFLDRELRRRILGAAVKMASHFPYRGLGTFEFLVDADAANSASSFFFMEANPRIQVEHTITEEITGLDLVALQIEIARGRRLAQLGLGQPLPEPDGFAVQLRINLESMNARGETRPEGGTLTRFEPATGPGVRVDTYGYTGYRTNPNFDSLLAKLIVRWRGEGFPASLRRAERAAGEFRVEGVKTNITLLRALLSMSDIASWNVDTTFVEKRISDILTAGKAFEADLAPADTRPAAEMNEARLDIPANTVAVAAPLLGTVASLNVNPGDTIPAGQVIAVLEAMKMEHVVTAGRAGTVRAVATTLGDTLAEGAPIIFIEEDSVGGSDLTSVEAPRDLDVIRPDLQAVIERHRIGLDPARPDAVERRRARGQRTARENIADLCDPGSFAEYGALNLAAQRQRRNLEELVAISPADGLVAGIGAVNGTMFPADRARCMVMAYDFTVFAGTQGWMNHKKKDRLLELAERLKLPIVVFGEGGGGRPGETDGLSIHGLDTPSFARFAKLSGKVPLVAVVSGRCFAGNAALVGCCDVIIATRDSNLGMGGPAMIEGGGLGRFKPEDIGPVDVQSANGVVDIVVEDEAEAVAATKTYLSYFQGPVASWECADQRELRWVIPENRRRSYDIREAIALLADKDSVLELRRGFGPGMVTALIRTEGRPMGLIANNSYHLGGAIDATAAEKSIQMMRLCNAFGLPILNLCDTPGFMVGPEAEKAGQVRRSSAMFLTAAALKVPVFTVVLRKGYGLGAQSMAAGGFHSPVFTVAWPTGEFGGMGIEGAVRLGYRRELEAISDPEERQRFFESKTGHLYDVGKAVNMAAAMEIDAVIDPAETRSWIMHGLNAVPLGGLD
jgi:acetyl-CoA carboxylase carboxyltransferase component/biotin carboxyl carrier protein